MAMTPDREIDALVATHVMGWRQDEPGSIWWHDGRRMREILPFSSDLATAWAVWEKLPEPRRLTDGEHSPSHEHVPYGSRYYVLCGGGSYGAETDFSHDFTGWGDTPAEAICRAALQAVGVPVPSHGR